jgi:hypothetical protein
MNYGKYVDEIRAIRDRQYDETQNMTVEERRQYTREKAERVAREIVKLRVKKEAEELVATHYTQTD